ASLILSVIFFLSQGALLGETSIVMRPPTLAGAIFFLCLTIIVWLASLICGIASLVAIKRNPSLGGKGLAITGIVFASFVAFLDVMISLVASTGF
ncbi:MAG: hypothetical protein PHN89_04915, partial [Candidatus Pacebacteria bacterium]|nr:hypothetical protein [Candidatus Paceibacterota bacterium]